MAFFPCIYFESVQQMYYSLDTLNNRHKTMADRIADAIERAQNRTRFHVLLYQLVHDCVKRSIPLIIENPAGPNGFITSGQNFMAPTFIDRDRTRRGDIFVKPTAYWFINCDPTYGLTEKRPAKTRTIKSDRSSGKAGICSTDRSMITPDYARNFIHDFILGKPQVGSQLQLFDYGRQ